MSKGGARIGAGRKKGPATIEREKLKDYIAQRIAEAGPMIVDALLDKAVTGDVPAIKELFDRGFGKPMQAVEMTGKNGKDLFTPSQKIRDLAAVLNELQKQK